MNEKPIPHEDEGLERALSSRHINMIAIGGAIGVGLFLGSGTTISKAGPGILLTYAVAGVMIFFHYARFRRNGC